MCFVLRVKVSPLENVKMLAFPNPRYKNMFFLPSFGGVVMSGVCPVFVQTVRAVISVRVSNQPRSFRRLFRAHAVFTSSSDLTVQCCSEAVGHNSAAALDGFLLLWAGWTNAQLKSGGLKAANFRPVIGIPVSWCKGNSDVATVHCSHRRYPAAIKPLGPINVKMKVWQKSGRTLLSCDCSPECLFGGHLMRHHVVSLLIFSAFHHNPSYGE